MKEGVTMETQEWLPEPLPRRKKPSERKPRHEEEEKREEEEEEPDISELFDWFKDSDKSESNYDGPVISGSGSTYRMGGGG